MGVYHVFYNCLSFSFAGNSSSPTDDTGDVSVTLRKL